MYGIYVAYAVDFNYSSLFTATTILQHFVGEYLGESVQEETFTHSLSYVFVGTGQWVMPDHKKILIKKWPILNQ